jgi:hypothetical protein
MDATAILSIRNTISSSSTNKIRILTSAVVASVPAEEPSLLALIIHKLLDSDCAEIRRTFSAAQPETVFQQPKRQIQLLGADTFATITVKMFA